MTSIGVESISVPPTTNETQKGLSEDGDYSI